MRIGYVGYAMVASVRAANELQAYIECDTQIAADGTSYGAMVVVTACSAITADECATAAAALDQSANAAKNACVAYKPGCSAVAGEEAHATCETST